MSDIFTSERGNERYQRTPRKPQNERNKSKTRRNTKTKATRNKISYIERERDYEYENMFKQNSKGTL